MLPPLIACDPDNFESIHIVDEKTIVGTLTHGIWTAIYLRMSKRAGYSQTPRLFVGQSMRRRLGFVNPTVVPRPLSLAFAGIPGGRLDRCG